MKIAFLTREYPPDTLWGGEAVAYYNLARGLAERGHEVHVICQAVDKPKDFLQEGVFIHRVGTNSKRYSAIARINYSFHAWQKLKKIIKKRRIEIVVAPYWSAEGFLYCLRKQTPLIVQTTSSPRDAIRTKSYSGIGQLLNLKILSFLADFTARRANRIIADSKANYDQVIEEIHIKPDKINIVHLTVDASKFRFVESGFRHRLGIPPQMPLILSIGRLEARKGIHILSQAIPEVVKNIPEVKFVLVGRDTNTAPEGGSFKRYIIDNAQVYDCQNNLVFFDSLPEDELIQLYSACDAFVFPSLKESFGLPVIEAMACGKPVVATPVGIVPELEPYRLKGLEIIPVGDVERLVKAVLKFLSLKDEERQLIARENRELAEMRFPINSQAESIIRIYTEVLNRRV